MYDKESLRIDLKSLPEGLTAIDTVLDDGFFEAVDAPQFHKGRFSLHIDCSRTADFFEFMFHVSGYVVVTCDRCLDDMEQPVTADDRLAAKFGEENTEEDNLVTVAENEGILDVAWFVYELIALNVPIKHVHAPGKCNPAMIRLLDEHSAARSGMDNENNAVDPRWKALLKLKEKNK